MDRRLPQQRSKYGDGLVGRNNVADSADLVSAGNGQLRRRLNDTHIASKSSSGSSSPMEENSFACGSRRSSSGKVCGKPIKTLIQEEMSREKESRRTSPSVIARLMGLDTLPPCRVLDKQQKDSRSYLRKTTHAEDLPRQLSNREHEFKDVFEIGDSMKAEKHKNQPHCKGTPSSKRDEADVEFIKQKFMEAKRLSTDETLQNSKQFNDALEVLDSNKELFLKVLQEPLFAKHLHDLKCFSSSPQESQITILKSSKGKKHEIVESICNSEGKAESCHYLHKDVISSYRKPTSGSVNHSLKEHNDSLSHKLLKSWTAGKTKSSFHPTRIVVLKPSLEKSQNLARNVSAMKSHENYQPNFRRHRNLRQSGVQELNAEGRERQKLYDNVEAMGYKTKGSREIAREITKQMKRSVSGSDKMPVSGFNKYIKDESLCTMSSRYSSKKFEAYQWTPKDYLNDSCSPSSSCSTESSVNREAKKRLSERWRMTRIQEARLIDRGMGTLGEMLALSDRDASGETLMFRKVSDEQLARNLLGRGCHPSGISSRDGWKEGCSKNLSRPTLSASAIVNEISKPSSRQRVDGCYMLKDVLNLEVDDSSPTNLNQRGSSSCRSLKSRSYKSHSLNSGGEENKLPVREIHVNKEELRKETNSIKRSEVEATFSEFSVSTSSGFGNQVKDSSVGSMNAEVPFITNEGHVQDEAQDEEFSEDVYIDKVLEETSADHPQVDSPLKQGDRMDPESHRSLEEADQPSPVSVLELPYEEESSPECFERVSADLQELRMQLQLLRLETSETNSEECEALVLSEDDTGDSTSPAQIAEMPQTFRNEEERAFSYVLDILVCSGIHEAKPDGCSDTCYSTEHPVDPYVFERLEKKYGAVSEWSRSQRKLFFDHTNSILAEILTPFNETSASMWDRDRICEEIWQMMVRQQKELSEGNPEANILSQRWLVSGDSVDMIGREIEGMVKDDLFDELISEFVFG